jgi:hypothetical protein
MLQGREDGMRPLRAVTVRVVAALLTLSAVPVFADWRRIESPNFVVLGDVGAGDLREITGRFESFREVLSRVLTEKVVSTAVPTVVLVFPSDRAFTPFKPKFNGKPIELTGLFLPRRDANYIALVRDWDEGSMRVVFHEYAHLITSNIAGSLPVWLNEGLAEFYSTFETVGDREALIGRTVPGHLDRLNETRLLTLDELLNVKHDSPLYNEGDRRSVFYAQSWALTHMLLAAQPSRRDKLGAYMASVENGMAPTDAWRASFGADRIDRELQNYIRRNSYNAFRFQFSEKTTSFNGTAAPVTAGDAEAILALFLAQQQRYDEALDRLGRVPAGGDGAWPSVVRATIAVSRQEGGSAETSLLQLPDSPDWLVSYFAGTALADLVSGREDAGSDASKQRARSFFDKVQKAHGEIPNALATTVSLAVRGRGPVPPETITLIERARALAPGRHDYVFLHAQVLARMERFPAAARLLRSLMAVASSPGERESAERMLRYVEEAEKWKAAAADRPERAPTEPYSGGTPAASRTEPKLIPTWRVIGPDEDRIEGILERIECDAKHVAFQVKTEQGQVRLTATALDQVEFITYRDDLSGAVTCGPLKQPLPVYVTRAFSADRKSSRVVAVEFHPKPE